MPRQLSLARKSTGSVDRDGLFDQQFHVLFVAVCRNANANTPTIDDVWFAVRVDASLGRRQSQAFGRVKIDLPTLDAKERCARLPTPICSLCSRTPPRAIAVYLQTHATCTRNSLFSKLQAHRPPSSRHWSQTSTSPPRPPPRGRRPPTPPSPFPLPSSHVPLGAARAPGPALTKRPSLFSNERFKGMLSRNITALPVPSPPHRRRRKNQADSSKSSHLFC